MKLHSIVDLITNSSQEIFLIKTDKSLEEVEITLRDIYNRVCQLQLPFPFSITKLENDDYYNYEFTPGYYWGFTCTTFDDYPDYDSDAEYNRFIVELEKEFPIWESDEWG